MTSPRDDVRAKLHRAQTSWVLEQLDTGLDPAASDPGGTGGTGGPGGTGLQGAVAVDVRTVLEALRGRPLGELLDPQAARRLGRAVALGLPLSPVAAASIERGALVAHHHVGDADTALGDVVARDDVEAMVDALLALRGDGRLLADRLMASPTAMRAGVRLVGRIVADVLAQNRALAERLPGVGGLISLGTSLGGGAMNRAGRVGKAVADSSGLDRLVGDALGAGAQATLRRTSGIVHEVLTDEVVRAAALELYDAYAATPVAQLRLEATDQQIAAAAAAGHGLVAGAAASPVAGPLVDAQVDAFLDAYADVDMVDLLRDLGVTEDLLAARLAAALLTPLARLRDDGTLERLVHDRLAPFWRSAEVRALLEPDPAGPAGASA